MFKKLLFILKIIITFLIFPIVALGAINNNLHLTQEEQNWLATQKEIKIGIQKSWIPLSYVKNGTPKGLGVDYINLINTKLENKIIIVADSFKNNLEKVKSGTLDAMIDITPTESRKEYYAFTSPYASIPHYILTRSNSKNQFKSIEDIKGKTIAVENGYGIIKTLKELSLDLNFKYYQNSVDAIEAVAAGEADLYIGNRAVANYIIQKNFITNLEFQGKSTISRSILAFGVNKEKTILRDILQKAFDSITQKQQQTIFESYVGNISFDSNINLTKEEIKWLQEHPILNIGNEYDYAPWDFNKNGKPMGYSVDYLNLLASKLGIEFKHTLDTWDGLTKKLEAKKIDLLHTMYNNDTTRKNVLYSDPYKKIINALFVHKNNDTIKSISDLSNKTVSITKGDSTIVSLRELNPSIKIVEPEGYIEAIKDVALKRADATVLELGVANYLINDFNIPNIKIVDEVEFKSKFIDYSYCIGVRDDYPLLISILNKAMKSVSEEEKRALDLKWLNYSSSLNSDDKEYTHDVHFSDDEKEWLSSHREILFTGDPDWLPFEAFNSSGEYIGIVAEHLQVFEEILGIKFKFIQPKTWSDAVQMTLDGKVDMISEVVAQNTVSKAMNYSLPYIKTPLVTIVHKDSNIQSIENLNNYKNKKIAYVKDYGYVSDLKRLYPKIDFIEVDTVKEGLEKVALKQIDIMILTLTIGSYNINDMGLSDLEIVGKLPIEMKLGFGVRKDWQKFIEILNKVIESIDKKEQQNIMRHWVVEEEQKINLTKKEEKWIKEHEVINYVYDIDWAPFEWRNELEEHAGITYDILSLIEKRTGIKFKAQNTKNWKEAIESVKSKNADMFSAVGENSERQEYLNFTQNTIFSTPYVFVTKESNKNDYLDTFRNVKKEKVALVQNYAIEGIVKKNQPELRYFVTKTVQEGFEKLRNKDIDIFIVNAVTAKYFINRLGFKDLKIAGKTQYNLDLKIALRKEFGEVPIAIIDKALESIDEKERSDIYFKWTEAIIESKIDWSLIYKISSGALILLFIIVYWNRKLKSLVDIKTSELKILLKSFDKNVIASKTDVKGNITYVSDAFCAISGFSKDELIGKPHSVIRHKDMNQEVFQQMWNTLKEERVWKGEVKNLKKDGSFYWVYAVISPEYNFKNEFVGYSAITHDITAKKEVEELSRTLEQKVEERTEELSQNKKFLDALLDSQEQIVITTDGFTLRSANKRFLEFFGISDIEEFKKYHNCICDKFKEDHTNTYIQKFTQNQNWLEYVINNKDKTHKAIINKEGKDVIFTVTAAVMPINNGNIKSAVFTDITELENVRKNIEMILSNIMLPVLITSQKTREILYANEYASIQYERSVKDLVGKSIDTVYTTLNQQDAILAQLNKYGYVENLEQRYKTNSGKEFIGLLSVKPIVYDNQDSYIGMVVDITRQKDIEQEIREIHKNTQDSIEYASLIQHALLPSNELFKDYFDDYFMIWQPKDIVGGDIYLFQELRNENEAVLMVIDCTGHGVPGAFVTMLVKAIERQIVSNIINSDEEVNPAKILSIFNRSMKHLLKQEDKDSISNAGFDGGILYYNKKNKVVKFAGANIPLFYMHKGELKTLKGDRHSIGYKKSNSDFEFTQHIIEVDSKMQFYMTTDGYLDQNGGEKGYPFGKKEFSKLIQESYHLSFADQKELFLYTLQQYQGDEERNDDIAVVGIQI